MWEEGAARWERRAGRGRQGLFNYDSYGPPDGSMEEHSIALEDFVKSQSQKDKYRMITILWGSWRSQIHRDGN